MDIHTITRFPALSIRFVIRNFLLRTNSYCKYPDHNGSNFRQSVQLDDIHEPVEPYLSPCSWMRTSYIGEPPTYVIKTLHTKIRPNNYQNKTRDSSFLYSIQNIRVMRRLERLQKHTARPPRTGSVIPTPTPSPSTTYHQTPPQSDKFRRATISQNTSAPNTSNRESL